MISWAVVAILFTIHPGMIIDVTNVYMYMYVYPPHPPGPIPLLCNAHGSL